MRSHRASLCAVLAVALSIVSSPRAASSVRSNDAIRRMLVDRVDLQKQGVGIVVGVIEPAGRHLVDYGRVAKTDPRSPDGDLLDSEAPLAAVPQVTAPKARTATSVDTDTLDRYVGRYQFAPAAVMTVSRDGEHLMAQLTGQPKVELYPEGDHEFFLQVVDAQISFEVDDKGRATALVMRQLGRDQRAPRIEGEPVAPKEVAVAPDVFDRYVGQYEFAPSAVITISREGTHFYEQLTGQAKFEIFASSEREYFLKVVDAQITFDVDSQMRTTSLVLLQGGREIRAVKNP